MNNTYRITALWMMCLMLLGSISFSACDDGDEENTNQYIGGISLNVFGPCPVARGGQLRFLGSGMDRIQAVIIPGCDDITDIEVVNEKEIRVTVPQTAQEGYIVLKTPTSEITTKTKITYSEPIGIEEDAISPNPVKPGEVLTIPGEYLNLIQEIIFAEKQTVKKEDFVTHSRKEIKVKVPMEAQTGDITLADASADDENAMRNLFVIEGIEIVLPSVEAPLELKDKKPGDEIKITGKNLDLVTDVRMPNGESVEFAYVQGEEVETLTFSLSENASDGSVVVIPASGVEVLVATLEMAVPLEVQADKAEGLVADDEITLSGENMNLVTTVTFPGVAEPVEPSFKSDTEVKVAMPAAATSGDLLLNLASGKSVSVAIVTQKPVFTAFAENTLSLGSEVTIQGEHLNLVSKIIYTGGAEVEVTPTSETELTVTMPTTGSETGVLTLVMANGESVETDILTIQAPEFCYIPELPGEDAELQGGTVFSVAVSNGDKLTGVEIDGTSVQYIINGDLLYISIPQLANANSVLKLTSSNGSVEYHIAFIPATNIKNEVWKGMIDITWGTGGRVIIPAEAFKDVPAGARMVLHYAQKDEVWGQAQINYGNFTTIDFSKEGEYKVNGKLVPTDVYGWNFDNRSTPLVLTREILDNIQANQGECDDVKQAGVIIQGSDLIFTSVTLEWEISLEETIWEGNFNIGNWGGNQDLAWGGFDWSSVKAGQVLTFYFSQNDWSDGYWQLSMRKADGWKNFETSDCPEVVDLEAGSTSYSITLTQSILDELIAGNGLVFTGKEVTVHKITLL